MPISVWKDKNMYSLQTKHSSYVFCLNEKGIIQHLHWGEIVDPMDCASLIGTFHHSSFDAEVEHEMEEYSFWGGATYTEPCIKLVFHDDVRDLKMTCTGFEVVNEEETDLLVLSFRDVHYELEVKLLYRVWFEYDLIERFVEVINHEPFDVELETVQSAAWTIPQSTQYRLTHVSGKWSGEFQLQHSSVTDGKKIIESRQGFTSSHANPWFAIDNGHADEQSGKVWFGVLGWSGNWKIVTEKTPFQHVRVIGGIHDFDSKWILQPGEHFSSPSFYGGYTSNGFGAMSRKLHRFQREYLLPSEENRKILYNSWEATGFDVNVEGQLELAEKAARLGIELFVMDDGWFGERHNDRAGLGDWYVNPVKFPNGLNELIQKVHDLGMDFGLWVEPESVNPDSNLYRNHPDWVYQFPTREGTTLRNQLLLNLANAEVQQYIIDFMSELLSSYKITFIKWDMNRTITEPGLVNLQIRQQREIWIRHVRALYDIWRELRKRFPNVTFETCAGGGSRIDFGILRYADQAWPSDNTDAFDRLLIQEGFSYTYTPKAMMCWVTDSPHGFNKRKLPLQFRFLSSFLGVLGVGGNLLKWTEEEMAQAATYINLYKDIRPIIQNGDLYRLSSFRYSNMIALQYLDKKTQSGVIIAFNHSQQFANQYARIQIQGLNHDSSYVIEDLTGKSMHVKGSFLMNIGIQLDLTGDFDSNLYRFHITN